MKTTRNGATLVRKGAPKFHNLLPRCKDHPALVDDAANADALSLTLLLLLTLLELVELVVDVPVGGRTVGVSTSVEVMSVEVDVVTGLEVKRDVVGSVAPSVESEDADDDEVGETGEAILVMAKMELVSPESPNKQMR